MDGHTWLYYNQTDSRDEIDPIARSQALASPNTPALQELDKWILEGVALATHNLVNNNGPCGHLFANDASQLMLEQMYVQGLQ